MRHQRTKPTFRSFVVFPTCSESRDVNARNPLFLKLFSLASSSFFSSPPEADINPSVPIFPWLTDRLGAILGHLGGQFFCDVNAFSARSPKSGPLTSLKLSSRHLMPKSLFARRQRSIFSIVFLRARFPVVDGPSWGHLGVNFCATSTRFQHVS